MDGYSLPYQCPGKCFKTKQKSRKHVQILELKTIDKMESNRKYKVQANGSTGAFMFEIRLLIDDWIVINYKTNCEKEFYDAVCMMDNAPEDMDLHKSAEDFIGMVLAYGETESSR